MRSFATLYLPFRPQLATDFFTIIAITLTSAAQEHTPFVTTVEVLQLLLKQTIQDGVGDINQEVWEELVSALVHYVKHFSVTGRLQTLNDMPVRHWRLYAQAVLTGMLMIGV